MTFQTELKKAVEHLKSKDKKLSRVISKVGPCRLKLEEMHSPFASLAESIIYQQLSGKAAATICGRVKSIFQEPDFTSESTISNGRGRKSSGKKSGAVKFAPNIVPLPDIFPEPHLFASVSDDRLRAAGLSRAKTAAIRDLAEKTIAGVVPTMSELSKMSDEEIIECLTQIRGVGRWTVEMLLIFRLGRMDVFPATDYGVRKGFALLHKHDELPAPGALMEHSRLWQPYRSVAAWYLWRALEL